jgi:hypothetical protein
MESTKHLSKVYLESKIIRKHLDIGYSPWSTGDRLWSGSWSETVAATIGIMANVATIAMGIGKLLKLLRGRKET